MIGLGNSPLKALFKFEKKHIRFIFIYAIISGLISLILPLGVQSSVGLIMAGRFSNSWFILLALISIGVGLAGLCNIAQINILEIFQRKIFVLTANNFLPKYRSIFLGNIENAAAKGSTFLDVITIQKSFTNLISGSASYILQLVFGLILLVIYHPIYWLFCLSIIVFIVIVLAIYWKKGLHTAHQESTNKFKTAEFINHLAHNELFFSQASMEKASNNKLHQYVLDYVHARQKHFTFFLHQISITLVMKVAMIFAFLLTGSALVISEEISLGQFLASEILIFTMVNAAEKLITYVEYLYDTFVAVEKVGLNNKNTEWDMEKIIEESTDVKTNLNSQNKIDWNGLTITYKKTKIKINKGNKISVLSPPGLGRSLLLRAIANLGTTEFDVKIDDIPIKDLYNQITVAFCMQKSILIPGTIQDNVCMLKTEIDLKRLTEIAKVVNVLDYINSMPHGWETACDFNTKLPNNVLAKICLARSLYENADIVLIDDIWHAFNKNEIINILEYLNKLQTTVIVVSNHFPVLKNLDKTVYISENNFELLEKMKTIPSELSNIIWQ